LWRKTNRKKTAMPDPFADIQSRIRAFMRASLNSPADDSAFDGLALELHHLQRRHNAAYQKLCELRGNPKVQTWRDIPCAPTAAFKELDLTSLPCAERHRVFYSSGTTHRERSKHFHCPTSLALYEDSLWLWFEHNFRERLQGHKLIFLTPRGVQAPNSSLVHMFETIASHVPAADCEFLGETDSLGNWTLNLARCLDLLKTTTQPVAIFGTAFQFVLLLDELVLTKRFLNLRPNSWLFETGGYKGRTREIPKNELHLLLKHRFSTPNVFSEYGMSELSSQAYSLGSTRASRVSPGAPPGDQFQFPPWARARIVSPANGRDVADGERGLIRVYDLANVWSVMAVQTEDLAIKTKNGFALAGRAAEAEARGCSLMNV
jgi:hypothetical protein